MYARVFFKIIFRVVCIFRLTMFAGVCASDMHKNECIWKRVREVAVALAVVVCPEGLFIFVK